MTCPYLNTPVEKFRAPNLHPAMLVETGYQWHPANKLASAEDGTFFKRIGFDGRSYSYHLCIRLWDFTKYRHNEGEIGMDVELCLETKDDMAFRVTFSIYDGETIESVEARCRWFFETLDCQHYEERG